MDFQNVQDKNMSLLLSSDAKPRLKWTPELHQRFVGAVHQLGGAEKATPKSLMRVMGIHGLTLYHLKSHLQKYRLGKSPNSPQNSSQNKQEEYKENYISQISEETCDGPQEQINESLQVSQALQIQMEVQRKLHEQIEVQKHLQLRIEAQGKYLQSVLKKAQETLANYHSSSIGIEAAKTELSQLVSLVDTGCNSSSLSVLTEIEGSLLKDSETKQFQWNKYSPDSSQTSSESSGRNNHDHKKAEIIDSHDEWRKDCVVLPLMEMHPTEENQQQNSNGMKRRIDASIHEQSSNQESRKRYHQVSGNNKEVEMFNFMEPLDLNRKCLND
ncbi:hypothetical protein Leryth_002226 [Lithospermum erythrorhizon]|nr:hypothetical protein Leryth_002226 [Lithospermum erythrorhizon]